MTAKQQVIRAMSELPDDASVEDAMERLYFLLKIQRGIEDAEAGKVVSHEEIKSRFLGD